MNLSKSFSCLSLSHRWSWTIKIDEILRLLKSSRLRLWAKMAIQPDKQKNKHLNPIYRNKSSKTTNN